MSVWQQERWNQIYEKYTHFTIFLLKLHSHKSGKPFPTHTGMSKYSVTIVFM